MKVDFQELKTRISLPDFLIELGWKPVSGSSIACPKLSNGKKTVVIKRNSQGQYTYWDVHNDSERGRSILDLMQEHLRVTTGKDYTLREVGEVLQHYLETRHIVTPEESSYAVGDTHSSTELETALTQLKPYQGQYLQDRGITLASIESATFQHTFYIREVGRYQNLCVKMYNEQGVQALSQRNSSFKGILGRKFVCLAMSDHNPHRMLDILYIGESMIDCISHYQLHHSASTQNVAYVSSEGTLTEGQIELLAVILQRKTVKEIRTLFDNDKQGYKYTLWIYNRYFGGHVPVEDLTPEAMRAQVMSLPFVDLPSEKDWNDELMKRQALERSDAQDQIMNLFDS